MSLGERTRVEKKTTKIGFDWIIYNLALSNNWTLIRLPFFRQPDALAVKTKSEAEFGMDFCFLSPKRNELFIFVLKDEELNNKNWTGNNFDKDLRMASAPDISHKEFCKVNTVKVILAYNKDEDRTGTELFDRLTASLGTKIKDNITLSFERWNISKIVEEVKTKLISPDLLPQHLSSQFNYICSQIADFNFGSIEWEKQLIPNWKSFLNILLTDPIDERKLRLIPVTLIILHHYRKKSPNSYPGWIDLIEWAMLSLWACYSNIRTKKLKDIISDIWIQFYISELGRYFSEISDVLITQHGLHNQKNLGHLCFISDAFLAYWHIGRLGILATTPQEYKFGDDKDNEEFVVKTTDWLIKCLHLNPSAMRPLIDLNHIELFLIWLMFWQSGREDEIYKWLSELEMRLLVRRTRYSTVPFIEGRNRMDLVAEYGATSKKPSEFTDRSSYLLLMILEICFSLEDSQRDELLNKYYKRIVRGIDADGNSLADFEIDLIAWFPPDDWEKRILKERVTDGIGSSTDYFFEHHGDGKPLSERIQEFVKQSREKFPFKIPVEIPRTVFILACIKHHSPLPAEFWRATIFKK
ncbi:MAG: hypothetical protein ACFFG0_26735 [Candidatus Thorarchaeota archaeon]